jgi:hypothetical protein
VSAGPDFAQQQIPQSGYADFADVSPTSQNDFIALANVNIVNYSMGHV